uniref:Uncharacterized protein n=1 Tax=Nelumbo nucifera TaxID=4432 RepID=A0A822YL22_NELNU|nr:TPA_asm: hypothetical protein HUJ06_011132 [Nelumbo nucifera]
MLMRVRDQPKHLLRLKLRAYIERDFHVIVCSFTRIVLDG